MLKTMKLFVGAADAGSFTRLAHLQGVTTSSITKQIDALEKDLGVALVIRHSRGITLTDAGVRYVARVREILRDVTVLHQDVRQIGDEPAGILSITTPLVFGRLHVAPRLTDFMARFPKVEVKIKATEEILDIAAEGIDVAIRLGELQDSRLIATRLAPLKRLICASPSYIARFGLPTTPYDLFKHNCLVNTHHTKKNVWFFSRHDTVHPVTVSGTLQTDDVDTLLRATLDGAGVALLGSWMVTDHLRTGELASVLPAWRVNVTPGMPAIHAVYVRTAYPAPKVKAFISFLRSNFGSPPYWDFDLRLGTEFYETDV